MEDSHSRLEPAQTGTYSNSFQICCWLSPTPEISVMIVNTNISFFLSLIFHSNLEQTLQLHFLWKVTTISPETMWIDYTSGIRMKHLHVTNFLLEKKKKKSNNNENSKGYMWKMYYLCRLCLWTGKIHLHLSGWEELSESCFLFLTMLMCFFFPLNFIQMKWT